MKLVQKISVLIVISAVLSIPMAHAAADEYQDTAAELIDTIEFFDKHTGPEATPEQITHFHAEVSKEMLKLSWRDIERIRGTRTAKEYLKFFPNFGCEGYRQIFVTKVSPALKDATKCIIEDDGNNLYTILVETATHQHAYRYNVQFEWLSAPAFISRQKTGTLHDFREFVARKNNEWQENAVAWRAAQD